MKLLALLAALFLIALPASAAATKPPAPVPPPPCAPQQLGFVASVTATCGQHVGTICPLYDPGVCDATVQATFQAHGPGQIWIATDINSAYAQSPDDDITRSYTITLFVPYHAQHPQYPVCMTLINTLPYPSCPGNRSLVVTNLTLSVITPPNLSGPNQ